MTLDHVLVSPHGRQRVTGFDVVHVNAEFAVQARDHDGSVPVTCAPASGAAFAPGVTTVTCRAGDTAGNLATRTFPVRVTFSAPAGGH